MFSGLILFFAGCVDEKDLYDPDREFPNPIEEITVPADFDWKTMNSMEMEVIVTDKFNGEYSYLIEVFDANPVSNTLTPITLGYAKRNKSFKTTLTTPKSIEYVYIRQTTPDGLISVRSAKVDGSKIVCDFSKSTPAQGTRGAVTRANDWNITPPEIDPSDTNMFPTSVPADAVQVPSSWIAGSANAWKNLIINRNVKNVDNVGQYVNLYVVEDATLSSIYKRHYKHIYILPGVKLTISGALEFNQTDWMISIADGAELVVEGLLKMEKDNPIYNLGTLTAKSIHMVGTSVLYNAGVIRITQGSGNALYSDTHSKLYNLNTINVNGDWLVTASENGELLVYNTNEINVTGSISLNTRTIRFLNDIDGKIVSTGFTSTGSSKTLNYGLINIDGHTQVESKDTWTNKGKWITETMGTKSYDAQFLNECYLEVKEKLSFYQGRFVNAKGSFITTKDLHIENTRIEMYDESFINATGTTFAKGSRDIDNEGVYGMGSGERSLLRMFKLTTDTDGQQHLCLSGNLQAACEDYPEQYVNGQYNAPVWVLVNGAEWATYNTNTVSIPKSECNDGWNPKPEEPEEPETEDNVDPFTYNYLFEDMWPFYGDYDMNDVVLRIRNITYYAVTKDNKTSKLSFEASPRASGAEKRIASALMLDNIQASGVKSVSYSSNAPTTYNVSGSGIEQNQTNAVVPLFDEVHKFIIGREGAWYINTKPDTKDNVANPPTMTVTVEFNNPVNVADLNVKYLNFFIITDIDHPNKSVKDNPRREIHLVDYKNTSMGETSFFGNNNDDSSISAGRYYRSKDNLPWAIVIPDEFKWPVETIKIQNAYKEFEGWVTSEGASNTEWYKNPVSGTVYELN